MLPHGIEVSGVVQVGMAPGNGLPEWVKKAAASRGYGDAVASLSLFITDDDIKEALAEAMHGDGTACVMAKAGRRLGAKEVYFYRTTAWVDFGKGPVVRYRTSKDIWTHVIEPFDKGAKRDIRPGLYHLLPPTPGQSLEALRKRQIRRSQAGTTNKPSSNPRPYMGRVVIARQTRKSA